MTLSPVAATGGMPAQEAKDPAASVAPGAAPVIAVLPFENLSAMPAPIKEMRASLVDRLRERGLAVLQDAAMDAAMAHHRIRYAGGINKEEAEAFRGEAGADAVLVTSLGLYMAQTPPKVAVASRLSGTGRPPVILWADSVALAGDESPGLLELGLVDDIAELSSVALDRLADSLARYVRSGAAPSTREEASFRFRPRGFFRASALQGGKEYTIAVLPVVNHGERRNAGELLALHFVEHLGKAREFEVVEPGLVRDELLRYRLVAPEGASLDMADLLANRLGVDLLLIAKVMEYDDTRGLGGTPQVTFFLQVIEGRSGEVTWSSHSTNRGDEGVFLFDVGKVRTAHGLASRMVAEVVQRMRGAEAGPRTASADEMIGLP